MASDTIFIDMPFDSIDNNADLDEVMNMLDKFNEEPNDLDKEHHGKELKSISTHHGEKQFQKSDFSKYLPPVVDAHKGQQNLPVDKQTNILPFHQQTEVSINESTRQSRWSHYERNEVEKTIIVDEAKKKTRGSSKHDKSNQNMSNIERHYSSPNGGYRPLKENNEIIKILSSVARNGERSPKSLATTALRAIPTTSAAIVQPSPTIRPAKSHLPKVTHSAKSVGITKRSNTNNDEYDLGRLPRSLPISPQKPQQPLTPANLKSRTASTPNAPSRVRRIRQITPDKSKNRTVKRQRRHPGGSIQMTSNSETQINTQQSFSKSRFCSRPPTVPSPLVSTGISTDMRDMSPSKITLSPWTNEKNTKMNNKRSGSPVAGEKQFKICKRSSPLSTTSKEAKTCIPAKSKSSPFVNKIPTEHPVEANDEFEIEDEIMKEKPKTPLKKSTPPKSRFLTVPVWNKVTGCKMTGNSAPRVENVKGYLKRFPVMELYTGQDKDDSRPELYRMHTATGERLKLCNGRLYLFDIQGQNYLGGNRVPMFLKTDEWLKKNPGHEVRTKSREQKEENHNKKHNVQKVKIGGRRTDKARDLVYNGKSKKEKRERRRLERSKGDEDLVYYDYSSDDSVLLEDLDADEFECKASKLSFGSSKHGNLLELPLSLKDEYPSPTRSIAFLREGKEQKTVPDWEKDTE